MRLYRCCAKIDVDKPISLENWCPSEAASHEVVAGAADSESVPPDWRILHADYDDIKHLVGQPLVGDFLYNNYIAAGKNAHTVHMPVPLAVCPDCVSKFDPDHLSTSHEHEAHRMIRHILGNITVGSLEPLAVCYSVPATVGRQRTYENRSAQTWGEFEEHVRSAIALGWHRTHHPDHDESTLPIDELVAEVERVVKEKFPELYAKWKANAPPPTSPELPAPRSDERTFAVVLTAFDDRFLALRELRDFLGMDLKTANDALDALPRVIGMRVPETLANTTVAKFARSGMTVELKP